MVLATLLSSIYFYYTYKLAFNHGYDYFLYYYKSVKMQWACSVIFTVGKICMSITMMSLLRIRFAYFYKEYGCFLWTVVTIQALSLIVQTTINVLISESDAIYSFVNGYLWDHQALNSTLVVIYNIVGFIVPLFTQLSCLIFVYIRSRRESKLPKTTSLVKNQTDHYMEKSE